jgi:hypothetical protein
MVRTDDQIKMLVGVFAENFFAVTEANFAFRFGHARHCMRRIVKREFTLQKLGIGSEIHSVDTISPYENFGLFRAAVDSVFATAI